MSERPEVGGEEGRLNVRVWVYPGEGEGGRSRSVVDVAPLVQGCYLS